MSNTVDRELYLGVDGLSRTDFVKNYGETGQCNNVYFKKGWDKFQSCNMGYQEGSSSDAKEYEQKLLNGYSGTFADFEKSKRKENRFSWFKSNKSSKSKHEKQYDQKVLNGYKGTFDDFETERKAKLKELGMGGLSMGLGLLDSFFKDDDSTDISTSNNHSSNVTVSDEPSSKVGLYIGIGISVAVLGIVAYKVFGKKGKS